MFKNVYTILNIITLRNSIQLFGTCSYKMRINMRARVLRKNDTKFTLK